MEGAIESLGSVLVLKEWIAFLEGRKDVCGNRKQESLVPDTS